MLSQNEARTLVLRPEIYSKFQENIREMRTKIKKKRKGFGSDLKKYLLGEKTAGIKRLLMIQHGVQNIERIELL